MLPVTGAVTSGSLIFANHTVDGVADTTELMRMNTNGSVKLSGGALFNYVAKTSTYIATVKDYFIDCTANTFTVTLPTAVGFAGQEYIIKNSGTGVITIGTTSSQTIDGVTTQTLRNQYECMTIISDGANWKIIG